MENKYPNMFHISPNVVPIELIYFVQTARYGDTAS